MISHQLVPPGGWRFKDGDIVFEAQSWGALVELVEAHRKSNGKFPGYVEQEIDDQIETLNPSISINIPKIKKHGP